MLTVLWHCVTRYSTNICTQYDLLCAVCFKIVSHSDLGQTLSESPTPNRLFISGWCQRAPGWYRGWASGKCCIQRWVFVWRPFVAFSALSHLHYCRLGMPSSPDYNDSSYYSLAFFLKMTVVETPALQLFFFSRPNSLCDVSHGCRTLDSWSTNGHVLNQIVCGRSSLISGCWLQNIIVHNFS